MLSSDVKNVLHVLQDEHGEESGEDSWNDSDEDELFEGKTYHSLPIFSHISHKIQIIKLRIFIKLIVSTLEI